jgi:hypothetical protein
MSSAAENDRAYKRAHSRGSLPLDADPKEVAARIAERDAREAMDSRTEAERWLGDPPSWRSALAGWPSKNLTVVR